jgi:hypothetical protein
MEGQLSTTLLPPRILKITTEKEVGIFCFSHGSTSTLLIWCQNYNCHIIQNSTSKFVFLTKYVFCKFRFFKRNFIGFFEIVGIYGNHGNLVHLSLCTILLFVERWRARRGHEGWDWQCHGFVRQAEGREKTRAHVITGELSTLLSSVTLVASGPVTLNHNLMTT